MINETIKATGELQIVLRDANGNIKEQKTVPNLVVTVGKTAIASRLVGTATAVMSHMAIGTSTTAAAIGQTTLVTETHRVALTAGTNSANVVTYTATFPPLSSMAITEAGILNAVTDGTLLCRTVFPVVNKDALDTLSINWQITIN